MTPDEAIAYLNKLADEATPGPWAVQGLDVCSSVTGGRLLLYGPHATPKDAELAALAPDLARLCAKQHEALTWLLVAKREYKIEYAGHIPAKTEAEGARDLARVALAELAELEVR